MFRLIAVAATLALLLPSLAVAQNAQVPYIQGPNPSGNPPPGKGPPGGPPGRGGPPGGQQQHGRPYGGPGGGGPPVVGGQPQFHRGPGGPPGFGAQPQFGRGPGGPGGQFSYRGRAFPGIHGAPYLYPPGWRYRRWGVGAVLPPLFLAPSYYYTGWASLGLAPPPPGYEWVRFGPDLLLVNIPTGQVVDVAYGVFY